ncbi:ATP-dependent DNA ligase [Actinomadura verrucosospora]|uniref:ATP-dependent DNA ligase LigC n=1 Tax=Actinomadura verrucosospora TaxID=46165 RepID=A0A7D3ZI70_ACTVE|nr:ATP-dependent DNA ligase [Actinomadura verrucosospora]QKG18723.1 ATP-dependent DNA ligase LigC [Actinomadura verrucosospora]
MAATAIDHIPAETACPGGCRYEPKWDGFRALAIVNEDGGVRLWSRRLKSFNDAFPEVVLAVFDALPAGTVVDGEIVRWGRDGRLDFAALQRRHVASRRRRDLALAEPCHYVVFDLLETGGTDYRPRPLTERRQALERLLADVPDGSLIVLCPQMRDVGEARLWFEILPAQGIEGLVVKAADGRYREGKRGWWKVKHRATTEAIIGGVTGSIAVPQTLILGRYERGGRLRVVGRTSPLPPSASHSLAALLTAAGDDHPWPSVLPAGWAGGLPGAETSTSYARVLPSVVAEISVDAAVEHGRWRHSVRYVRARPDLTPGDVPEGLDLE